MSSVGISACQTRWRRASRLVVVEGAVDSVSKLSGKSPSRGDCYCSPLPPQVAPFSFRGPTWRVGGALGGIGGISGFG